MVETNLDCFNYKKKELKKAVFLDRDGIINFDYGYIGTIDRFKIIPGVIESLKILQLNDYLLIIVTNQSGIGRRYFTLTDYEKVNEHMNKIFSDNNVYITDVFHCPHDLIVVHPGTSLRKIVTLHLEFGTCLHGITILPTDTNSGGI